MPGENEVVIKIEGETPAPAQESPSISAEALRLIEESAALRVALETFRLEIHALSERLSAHEAANVAEFAELRALIDDMEDTAEAAEEIALVAAEAAEEAIEETAEGADAGDEIPASVEEAEAAEPIVPVNEKIVEQKHGRHFVRI